VKITGTALSSMGTALPNGMVTLMPADAARRDPVAARCLQLRR
jgi:hypothetical protein